MHLLDYELLDSGDGFKLERFGNNIVDRPDKKATWYPNTPVRTWVSDLSFDEFAEPASRWQRHETFKTPWLVSYGPIVASLHVAESRNVGLFPEQENNWIWLSETLRQAKKQASVLNLFAYTGLASLVCAEAGAEVCHVDASKSTVKAAKQNQILSGLGDKHIRYIVEDASRFVERELRRGNRYDGIILDPPPIGRSKSGSFRFEEDVRRLLHLCKDLLTPSAHSKSSLPFVLLNCYALNYSADDAATLLRSVFPQASIESGELVLNEVSRDKALSCSVYARFSGGFVHPRSGTS